MIPKTDTSDPAPGAPIACLRCAKSGRNPKDFVQVVRPSLTLSERAGGTVFVEVLCQACNLERERLEMNGYATRRLGTLGLGAVLIPSPASAYSITDIRRELGDVAPEPRPVPNQRTPIADLVKLDLDRCKAKGRAKYGTELQAFNGRRPLVDLYQELLDATQYLKQELEQGAEVRVLILLFIRKRAENFRNEEAKAREGSAELKADELANYATALEDLARLIDAGAVPGLD